MVITEYKVVHGPTHAMNSLINERIKEGWQPYGNPQVYLNKFQECVMQVLVKYETKEPSS